MPNTGEPLICYAANASFGKGGQGEFLRQMVYAVDQFPRGQILSRSARSAHAACIDIAFAGWRRQAFQAVTRLRVLRRRSDLAHGGTSGAAGLHRNTGQDATRSAGGIHQDEGRSTVTW